MTRPILSSRPSSWHLITALLVAIALSIVSTAWGSPGAHGPNGEHLDTPAQTGGATNAAPRFEAQSETFELVGPLQGGELSILINRFATNEPVLNATVEIESGPLKAAAKFHADLGDYAVDDAALLQALALPGEHSLVITVLAGADTDLLDGTLVVAASAADAHSHAHDDGLGLPLTAWLALALAAIAAAAYFLRRRSRGTVRTAGGAL
ncbi:hypothetical protein [Pigmentiphaga sp.]|uniref:hypothetical protein n=1 Tax=Pigmentiphaga sp. TaxID=1977564 RepID=UPI0025F1BFD1|nr:hypothetical protein [Pigmentiphaga sp.]